jgi:Holliday junction resolvase RusA-like endonuclease
MILIHYAKEKVHHKELQRMIALDVVFMKITKVTTLTIEFFIPIIPPTTTHQEKQVHVVKGKPVFYEPAELKAARSKLEAHLAKNKPEKKYTGAIRLLVKWCFPVTGKHKNGDYKTTKPDTDNLQKLLKDVMTHLGYWKDDALVASEVVEKFWADIPGIYIMISEVEDI